VATVSINIGGSHILVGSCIGPSVLLKAAHVEVEVEEIDVALTAVAQDDDQMD
jgi:cleavage and polyadenylation specificity factor subunit 1